MLNIPGPSSRHCDGVTRRNFLKIGAFVGAADRHADEQCMTGWVNTSLANMGGRPSIGSALSRLQGPVDPSVPPFVGLAAPTTHRPWSDAGQVGFLGPSHAPFKPDG